MKVIEMFMHVTLTGMLSIMFFVLFNFGRVELEPIHLLMTFAVGGILRMLVMLITKEYKEKSKNEK